VPVPSGAQFKRVKPDDGQYCRQFGVGELAGTNMTAAPWLTVFPGLFIFLTIQSINYLGDGLRDALDPRHT
jgi:hypothetical protein